MDTMWHPDIFLYYTIAHCDIHLRYAYNNNNAIKTLLYQLIEN